MYHEQDFVDAGIQHVEAFFLDGSCPSREILLRVIESFEAVPAEKAFAVHCKAGLGRTGTCIGAYLMKHFGFTAKEAIAWMRICRPGCVIGPQQHYLEKIEKFMWDQGVAEGYIEMPVGGDKTASPVVTTQQRKADTEMSDAVVGRAGQAEGLLAARSRRPGSATESNTKNSSTTNEGMEKIVITSSALPATPTTPDSKVKPPVATVTPEQQSMGTATGVNTTNVQSTALWCG
jgi:hypothetical protein